MELIGRRSERLLLDEVLQEVRAGQSRILVLHGEPGVGKSALLDYLAEQASGCRLARASGVESEMELAYAALHQLCAPMLAFLDHLPLPQRDALGTAFGLTAGAPPDRLLVGLGVISLFSEVADQQPLVCLADDLQWMDRASAQVLMFVARRLAAESVALFLATRELDSETAKLPTLHIKGLREGDAGTLLGTAWMAPLDERIRDRIVAEARGNPLALIQLRRGFIYQELAGGFGIPTATRLSVAMEESFRRELAAVPDQTRKLLTIAAAEPLGDPALLWPAALRLGIGVDAAAPAIEAGLAQFGTLVRFRHPLVRSVAYRSAPSRERQLAHRALAEVTDPQLDPDRRAWHLAQSVDGPDDDVAAELERSAANARARGGLAAAAAFTARAAMLTLDPTQRAERALVAAATNLEAGVFNTATDLLAVAETSPLSDFQCARADLVRARLAYVTGRGSDAVPLLLQAARRLEPIDPALARVTYLDALQAASFAGRSALECGVMEVARAAQAAPQPSTPRLADVLLDGFAAYFTDGFAAALPILRRAVDVACHSTSFDHELNWPVRIAALHIWDDESWDVLTARHVEIARAAGRLTELPLALDSRAVMLTFSGQLSAAAALYAETHMVIEETGDNLTDPSITLAAFRGDQAELSAVVDTITKDVVQRGQGLWLTTVEYSQAVINNGVGNFRAALTAAQPAADRTDLAMSGWAAIELIEAAARSGMTDIAVHHLARLSVMTTPSGTDWALGVEARLRALLSEGTEADRLYQEAIERLGRTRIRTELARAHLLYGEWLRRQHRRTQARAQLRIAYDMLDAMGMQGFAERARRELQATGETARNRTGAVRSSPLTAHEAQIAQLAREGLSNAEIGARLFISAKTVAYHLTKVFSKLEISSRAQLERVLPPDHLAGER